MKRLFVVAVLGAAAAAGDTQAAGFYLQEQSVRGAGRAYSGEVADVGVASLWWNPAAIGWKDQTFEGYIGAHGVLVDADVTNDGSTITYPGGIRLPVSGEPRAFKPIQNGVAPNAALAWPIPHTDLVVGVSLSAPYNFTTKYRRQAWARYDALESRLNTADGQLTLAGHFGDRFAWGVGLSAEYSDAKLSTASPNLSPLLPDGVTQLSGDGWDWGWSVGGQFQVTDALMVGASYRSSLDHKLKGDIFVGGLLGPLAGANLQGPGKASFSTPWIATLGARYRITDRATLNAQVQRIGWGEFDAIRVSSPAGPQALVQDYKDVTSGGVGIDYEVVKDRLTLRAGVQYDPTPTPDDERTARVPDGDRWLFGAGASAALPHDMTLDLAFAYISFDSSRVRHDTTFYAGTAGAVTTRLDGDVKGEGYVLSAGITKAF